jgi:hypothetical protein
MTQLPTTGQIWPVGVLPCPEPSQGEGGVAMGLSAEPLGIDIGLEPLATINDSPSLQFIVPTINIF